MITTREVSYDVDGLTMRGHLAVPEGEGPWPTVLLGHDGFGLEEYQRSRADDLAAHGYLTLALDYHGGHVYRGEPQAMLARVLPLMADPDRMRAVGRVALDLLLAEPGADPDRLGTLGFGAGGLVVLELAGTGVPFRAVALVHPGLPEAWPERWATPTATFLVCTGSADPICPPTAVLAFGETLSKVGVDWRANVYGGAQHAFWARPTDADGSPTDATVHAEATVPGVGYHPAHTPRAWRAVLDLFDESLGGAGG